MSYKVLLIALLSVIVLTATTAVSANTPSSVTVTPPVSACLAACNATYNEENNWCNDYKGWQGGQCEELDVILEQCEQACQQQPARVMKKMMKAVAVAKQHQANMKRAARAHAAAVSKLPNPWNWSCDQCQLDGGACQYDQNGYSGCQKKTKTKKNTRTRTTVVNDDDDDSGCNETCAEENCVQGTYWYIQCMQGCGCNVNSATTHHVKTDLIKSRRAAGRTVPHDREVCVGSPWCTPPSPGCAGCQEMGEQCDFDYHGQFMGCM